MNYEIKNKLSILTLLTVIILTTIVVVLSIKITYIYLDTHIKSEVKVNETVEHLSDLLIIQVLPFINDYSPTEYETIIVNNMISENKFILAVEVNDYKMGEITGEKYIIGKIFEGDEIVNITNIHRTQLDDVCCKKISEIKDENGKILGDIIVYGYIKNDDEIIDIFFSEVLDMFLIVIVVCAVLLLTTRFFIVKPFNNLYKEIKSINLMDVVEIELKNNIVFEFETIKESFNFTLMSLKSLKEESDLKSENMEYMATHDSLTKLPNRTLLNEKVENSIAKTEKNYNHKFAILFIDLDHFKEINDTHGHKTGDMILIEAAKRFNNVKDRKDTLSRIGGDEFVLVVDDLKDKKDALEVAKNILGVFSELFVVGDDKFHLGCSIGISYYPDDGFDYTELLKHSDTAMYEAKANGRNRYKIFDENMSRQVVDKLNTENELRDAIKNGEIVAFFQPKINTKTKEIDGLEALVRWKKDEGYVSPCFFLPIAQQSALIVELDWIVMKQSIDFITQLHSMENNNIRSVSVNITDKEFYDQTFIKDTLDYMSKTGCKPEWIEFEITEDSLMTNFKEIIDIMRELEYIGIKFSLDDFGTGYSSLAYLKKLPIETIKIDKSFVDGTPDDVEDTMIASTIISLAKNMDLKIVAEGVETEEQAKFLVEYECDYVQGYYYHRPMLKRDLLEIIKTMDN